MNTVKKRGRGRPPKSSTVAKSVETTPVVKKRGRKKNIEKQSKQNITFAKENTKQSIIVQLKITKEDIEKIENGDLNKSDMMVMDTPLEYDMILEETYREKLKCSVDDELEHNIIPESTLNYDKKYNIIDDNKNIQKNIFPPNPTFKEFNERKFYKTNIACWWCCHTFTDNPCGIPVSCEKDNFEVKGVFCSFNCAMAHLLHNEHSIHQKTESINLMYLMYEKILNKPVEKIEASADKEVLEMFGGNVSIEEYRKNKYVYNITFEKLTYIIPQMEEIKTVEDETIDKVIKNNKKSGKTNNFFKKIAL